MPGEYVTIEVNGHEADQAAVSLLEHEGWGPTTISRVAVWAISLIRCDDTNTVRPSAASALSRLRIHSTPSGSRPLFIGQQA
jgi:hypothetical protein